jgi:hypothetical protein
LPIYFDEVTKLEQPPSLGAPQCPSPMWPRPISKTLASSLKSSTQCFWGVDVTAPAEEPFTHNVSSPAPLYYETFIPPFYRSQTLTGPTYHSRPAGPSSSVVNSQCLHCNPTKDDRPREAGQVSPTITSSTTEPQATTTVSWPAAVGVRTPGAEDETVSAHVPERGDAAALVLDE